MKIGVIGSEHVGQTLAKGFKGLGHDVRIASRSGTKLAAFSAETGVVEGTFADVATFADVVVLALKGEVAESVVRGLGAALDGKVVLDTTNPIAGPPRDGILPYFTGADESLLERLQAIAPAARFVKFFNSVGAGLMVSPKLQGGTPSMFICGNDAAAKATAKQLAGELGWGCEDSGSARAGHALEALCQIWCAAGFLHNDWAHAFAVLRP